MNRISLATFLSLSILLTFSCKKDKNCINGSEPVITKSISITDFDGVSIYTVADVIITEDSVTSMVIEGQSNVISKLSISNSQGHLSIGKDNCFKDVYTLRIYLSTPNLKELALAGSGNISTIGLFAGTYFNASISGSGNMSVSVDVNDFIGIIEGSGNITASGNAVNQILRCVGSGNFGCFGMPGKEGTVTIEGSSSCEVDVSDKLTVNITGSGNVYYKGNPILDVTTSGSGQMIKVN